MKKIRFFFTAAMAAILLGACSENRLTDPGDSGMSNTGSDKDGVYLSVNINLPSAKDGRSKTDEPNNEGGSSASDSGTEIGTDGENKISSALVVLAAYYSEEDPEYTEKNNGFIAAAELGEKDLNPTTVDKSKYTVNAKFDKSQLEKFYNSLKTTSEDHLQANVFIFCNPTTALTTAIAGMELGNTDWVNLVGTADNAEAISLKNNFLMSNSLIATRSIPGQLAKWNYYTTKDKPFNLSGNNKDVGIDNSNGGNGAIYVERTSARFDFRDGSPMKETAPFTYEVVKAKGLDPEDPTKETTIVNIELQRMGLVNVGKNFYYLRHTMDPAEGNNGEYVTTGADIDANLLKKSICLSEKPWTYNADGSLETSSLGNYVVDADYQWKTKFYPGNTPDNQYDKYFSNPFFNADGTIDNNLQIDRWGSDLCKEVVKGDKDNYDGDGDIQYHIWHYGIENTIPSIAGQVNAISTGVVFKGKMIATDAALESADENVKTLARAINGLDEDGKPIDASTRDSYKDPIIYQYEGNLYCTWENIRKAAIEAAGIKLKYEPATVTGEEGKWVLDNINRNAPLYKAVFGNCGFGTYKFTYTDLTDGQQKTAEYTDEIDSEKDPETLKEDQKNSPDYLWDQWSTKGKPGEDDQTTKDFKEKATNNKITIYQSSQDKTYGWGYYCYYYYWNRHNSNNNPGIMGPREFGVVRNNVYKLAVTKIKELGHPRISSNDPNKPKPDTKDENEDVYLTVETKVLPWVVRVNNIEF